MDQKTYRSVEGVWLYNFFKDEAVRSAVNYKPQERDVIVVTYPRCGTNWTVFIVYSILTRGRQPSNAVEYYLNCPYIDMLGARIAQNPSRIGPIFTHLPMRVFPPVEKAKYIYVTRNPYDCAVSMCHFLKGVTPKTFLDVSFEAFLPLFLSGKVFYGDYFEHLLPWYERRHDSNILFLTYEELKADTQRQVLKIAAFLGEEHAAALHEDSDVLRKVLNACSLENMKKFFDGAAIHKVKGMLEAVPGNTALVEVLKNLPSETVEMHERFAIVRNALIGEWRTYFTPKQIKQMENWILKKTQRSDVMTLWNNCNLPYAEQGAVGGTVSME